MVTERNLTLREDMAITPADVVNNAVEQAKLLLSIVTQTKCYQIISGKKYLQVEAWETIGAFNRVHAITRQMDPIVREGEVIGYQADVILLRDGVEVGGASMPCFFTENACKGKEGDAKHKASMSAAQTFATSKAYRMNYSYVAILAGYQPTPAEEMTGEAVDDRPANLEHWCEEHQTRWFKKGKMKSYAHPIEGTDEWCYERTPENYKGPKEKVNPDLAQSTKDTEELWSEGETKPEESATATIESQREELLVFVADKLKAKGITGIRSVLVNRLKVDDKLFDTDIKAIWEHLKTHKPEWF